MKGEKNRAEEEVHPNGAIIDPETREIWARRRLFNPAELPTPELVRARLEMHDRCAAQWPESASMGAYRDAVRSSYGSEVSLQLACTMASRRSP